jgi:FixJ family two-component response regulator
MTTGQSNQRSVVFVVDDDISVRESLSIVLQSVGVEVQAFASAQEFLQRHRPHIPSCLVLDVRLPGMSGLDFQAELAKANVQIPIIFITGHGDVPMTVRAMKAGAIEFLTKPFRDQDMIDAVQVALERDRSRRQAESAGSSLRASYEALSPRERQIMDLVTAGLMNKQIAGEIGISEATVKFHRASVMRKMNAKSLAELARMAEALGTRHTTS